ncbi:hypothetical protein ASE00_04735 [Sphingomonas sp. Root710]|uniref:Crp/Fnr family transcriptional regulator n=1 Tax=Sphingomonas sp. Root710 TaxID=1736594 RepID=UPI0006FD1C96|nr:Crp/Fnr family transcriptional regulator [Sphingomonas sp. Root710]KRB86053.1 hypothetical protein ASE00_04735 [Sphingomonas sp. Root710]
MIRLPVARYNEFIELSPADLAALGEAGGPELRYPRNQRIRTQGDRVTCVYLLVDGWVASSIDLANGHRQIVKIHLPGDLMGVPSITLSRAAETLTPFTLSVVRPVPLAAMGSILLSRPRLTAALFLSAQQERIILMDRITSLGRTNSAQRLATFLLHIYDRLRFLEPDLGTTFAMPITQEQIADVIGLTPIHVNRVFRRLEAAGLIIRQGRDITLTDPDALREMSGMPERRWLRQPEWLAGDGTSAS